MVLCSLNTECIVLMVKATIPRISCRSKAAEPFERSRRRLGDYAIHGRTVAYRCERRLKHVTRVLMFCQLLSLIPLDNEAQEIMERGIHFTLSTSQY